MNAKSPPAWADLAFSGAVLLFAAVVYRGTLELPEPRYEPMGSAALPQILALVMSALALVVGARALGRLRSAPDPSEPLPFRRRPWLAVGVFAVLIGYLPIMDARLLSFVPASILAFSLIGCMLTGFRRQSVPWVLAFVAAIVVVSWLVFTRLFYIDLP